MPAVQVEQSVVPVEVETRPASQAVQVLADAAEYWPLEHDAQVVADTSLYLPAAQSLHKVCAWEFWNWPALQLVQAVAPVEVPYSPVGQDLHAAEPVVSAYLPEELQKIIT